MALWSYIKIYTDFEIIKNVYIIKHENKWYCIQDYVEMVILI